MARLATVLGFGLLLSTFVVGCNDPKDPKTWIKKLRDPEHGPEAVRQLQKLGDPAAVKPLCDLFKDYPSVNILKAIISFKDKSSIPTLLSALDFTEDNYNNATTAAAALANFKATEAVDPLCKVLERKMAIKSRANLAKVSAVGALAEIGDKKAVPCLIAALERKPSEQDFFINKKAAEALGELGDPSAVSVLVRALFMSSSVQGTSYPQARVSLVQIGQPAIQPLIDAMMGKDEKLNAMPKEWEWKDEDPKSVILNKTAIVLGDMMAKEAVPQLIELLGKAKVESEDTTVAGVIEALGKIGDERAVDPLLKILNNKKANYKLRVQVCAALSVLGPKKALPSLLELSEKGFVEDGYTNLLESAAMTYSRIVGAEAEAAIPKFQTIMKNEKLKAPETQNLFKEALDRMEVAKECKDDPVCYGKKLTDQNLSLVRREKAGIMIGVLPDGNKAIPDLIKALPNPEPVLRLYFLMTAKRVGTAKDAELIKTLQVLAEKDSKRTIKALGADLASEDKVTLAVIKRKQ
jgi:HEAT repeat protein